MGIVDSKIDVMRKHRRDNSRIPNPQQQPSDPSNSYAAEVIPIRYTTHDLCWQATKAGPDELMTIIESLGGDVTNADSPLDNNCLHIAAAAGNLSAVRQLARRFHSLMYARNDSGDMPLHLGAEAGHGSVISELLSVASLRNYISTREKNKHGNTPLHKALISSNEAVARILVLVDPEAMFCLNNEDKSGLYLAAEAGYEGIITHTLNTYSQVNQIYELVKGKPPVHAAILGRHIGVLSILGTMEPRLFLSTDEEGRTPLHLAALTGYLDGVAHLLLPCIYCQG